MSGREMYPWELWQQDQQRAWIDGPRQKGSDQHKNRRRLKYAAGAVGGILVVDFVKRQVGKVPIIGPVVSPIFGIFVPTLIAGSLLGAAAVYGYERGDPLAARELVPVAEKKLKQANEQVKQHLEKAINSIAAPFEEALDEVARDLERQQKQLPPPRQQSADPHLTNQSYEDLVGAMERIANDLLGPGDGAVRSR